MPLRLVIFSDQASDHKLGEKVAELISQNIEVELEACSSNAVFSHLLVTSLQTVVLWSIDSTEREMLDTASIINQNIPPERVFAISSKLLNSDSPLVASMVFGHFFLRTEDLAFSQAIARIVFASSMNGIDAMADALISGSSVQKIELKHMSHRKAAIQAIQNILEKRELPDRICKKVAKGTDELLLNAFFRAPRNEAGQAYLADSSRTEDRILTEEERVQLEFVSHPGFFALSVRDQFGSLQRRNVQFQFTRDYKDSQYSLKQGLGIFQTFQGGLSVLFLVKPGQETRSFLIVPWVKSYKEFQSGFHFFSFIFDRE
jgi:hypothetical protein